jgi:hypothetical protein
MWAVGVLLGRDHVAGDPRLHAVEHMLHAACHIPGTTSHVSDGPCIDADHLILSFLLGRGHEAADPGLHAVEHLLPAAGHVQGASGHVRDVPRVGADHLSLSVTSQVRRLHARNNYQS